MELKYWLFCCLLPLLFSNVYGEGKCHQKNCFMASETKCDEWTHCDSSKNPKEEYCEESAIDLWVDIHDNNWKCIAKPHPGCELYKPENQPLHSSKTDIAYHYISGATFGKAESRCDELYFGATSIETEHENEWVKKKAKDISSGCLHGMIRRNGTNTCYRLSHSHADNRTGWREAKNRCEAANSTLLKIDDKDELDWIRAHMRDEDTKIGWDDNDHFWIGLMQKSEDLPWLWLDGTDMDIDITPWNNGEPNNNNGAPPPEHCVETSGHYEGMNDYDCNYHFRYVCEQEMEDVYEAGDWTECPEQSGFFIDPRSCKGFYECTGGVATHFLCPEDLYYDPVKKACHLQSEAAACYQYSDTQVYFILSEASQEEAGVLCESVNLKLVSVETDKENTFLNESIADYEDKFCDDRAVSYWTSGVRSDRELTPPGTRAFMWDATGSVLCMNGVGDECTQDYSSWCDGRSSSCTPDTEELRCLQLDTHYSGGLWNAAQCSEKKHYICESNQQVSDWKPRQFWTSGQRNKSDDYNWWWRRPSHHRIDIQNYTNWCNPDNPLCHYNEEGYDCLIVDLDLDTEHYGGGHWNAANCNSHYAFICEAPVQMQVPDNEFLHWEHCDCKLNKTHGFCEKYYTCVDVDGNCTKYTHHCEDGTLFDNDKEVMKCVDRADFPGDYCDSWRYNDTSCTETGIFKNKRNCGKFYACIANQDGTFLMKDFTCPEGWLYYDRTGVCVPKTMDTLCPFDYQIPDPVPQEASTQCTKSGKLIAYEDPYNPEDDDFIMCTEMEHHVVQVGPFYCPWGTKFEEGKQHCVL